MLCYVQPNNWGRFCSSTVLPLPGVISAVLALRSRLLGSFLQFYSAPACWSHFCSLALRSRLLGSLLQFYSAPACWGHFCSSSPALPFAGVVSAVLQCSRLLDSFLQYVRRANPVGSSSDPTQLFVTDFGLAELFQLTWPPCNTSLPVAVVWE